MIKSLKDTYTLNNGVKIPGLGLGVWQVDTPQECINAVKAAVKNGYISIDTAKAYDNEEYVGQAIKECDKKREELFITSKLWNADQGYDNTLKAFDATLKRLDMEYLDMYLIHWPVPVADKYVETWKAMEKLNKEGLIRAIGVSNFTKAHLQRLADECEIIPAVNQIEYHPWLIQPALNAYMEENNIKLEAWSPLAHGELLNNEIIGKIAEKYNKSIAQVIIKWDLQNGVITIPKSVKEERIIANADVFDFELSVEDMATINGMNKDYRTGPDPDEFDMDAAK